MTKKLNLQLTGNPFVDSGIMALKTKLNKYSLEDIDIDDLYEITEYISELYLKENWKKNMHSIFPNSLIVNNAIKGDRQKLYVDFLNSLIEDIDDSSDEGNCISCGKRNIKSNYNKSAIPLTGSGALKNYFSFLGDGADYCPLCALLIQFSPLSMYSSGGKMIVLHSNSEKVMEFWSKKALNNINKQISLNNYTGCFNEGFTNPTNAVFRMIENVIRSHDERWTDENPSLNFYYFTNYNQGPELDIFVVPTNVFKFLTYIPSEERYNWTQIVKNGYNFVKWDKVKNEEDYKNYTNSVYNNLLYKKSILKYFFDLKKKKTLCSWKLLKYYMREVRNMDEKRLKTIKNLGDNLSEFIKENDSKKTLSNLEQASNYNSFRNILRKIIKMKIANQDTDLLFTFDEYVTYLFPEGNLTWRETQDLLLFRIYEVLNEWLIENEYVEKDIIENMEEN